MVDDSGECNSTWVHKEFVYFPFHHLVQSVFYITFVTLMFCFDLAGVFV